MKYGQEHLRKKLVSVNDNVGVVILSRYSSRRLYGKALMEINGKKVLDYILERVLQVYNKDQVIIATSVELSDDVIEAFAQERGIDVYRGSLTNVSRRFFEAAVVKKWDYVARINGDNVLLDIPLLKEMTESALLGEYNFISNVKKRTYPKGMSIEIVKTKYYSKLLTLIERSPDYIEHVTKYLYEQAVCLNHLYFYNDTPVHLDLALDTLEDFNRISSLLSKFTQPHTNYNLEEILKILQNEN